MAPPEAESLATEDGVALAAAAAGAGTGEETDAAPWAAPVVAEDAAAKGVALEEVCVAADGLSADTAAEAAPDAAADAAAASDTPVESVVFVVSVECTSDGEAPSTSVD